MCTKSSRHSALLGQDLAALLVAEDNRRQIALGCRTDTHALVELMFMKNTPVALMNKARAAILIAVFFFLTNAISQVPGLPLVLDGLTGAAARTSTPELATEDWPQRLSSLQQSYAQWRDIPDPDYDELRRTAERLIDQLGSFILQRQAEPGPGVVSADMPTLVTAGKTAPFSML